MARLAEPAGTAETVETVRRRFLRQNRELARVNSNHSARISDLESQVTELLAENMELRQANIELEHCVGRWLARNCADVRAQLQAKMAEMDAIVGRLAAPDGWPARGSKRKSSTLSFVSTRKRRSSRRVTGAGAGDADLDAPDEGAPDEAEALAAATEALAADDASLASPEPAWEQPRRRRDSLQELDIVTMLREQSDTYKARMAADAADYEPPVDDVLRVYQDEPRRRSSDRRRSSLYTAADLLDEPEVPEPEPEPEPEPQAPAEPEAAPEPPATPRRALQQKSANEPPRERRRKKDSPKKAKTSPKASPKPSPKPATPRASPHKRRTASPSPLPPRTRSPSTASPDRSPVRRGRSRKTVNYALPSLRTKMRRETPRLVDAIPERRQAVETMPTHEPPASAPAPPSESPIKEETADDVARAARGPSLDRDDPPDNPRRSLPACDIFDFVDPTDRRPRRRVDRAPRRRRSMVS
ncbi:uncharacterized protein V1510DRAFT_427623 [Dipodascopsis tothii]|uniref:uncharacterized protein n=1 Tax=Dipodascopsis tothii TaxID=44089 RepID=UPI0034CDA4E4